MAVSVAVAVEGREPAGTWSAPRTQGRGTARTSLEGRHRHSAHPGANAPFGPSAIRTAQQLQRRVASRQYALATAASAAPTANIATSGTPCTKLVLKSSQVIDVAKYHRQDDLLIITDTQGRSGSIEIASINWAKTAGMTGSFRFVDTPQLVAQQH